MPEFINLFTLKKYLEIHKEILYQIHKKHIPVSYTHLDVYKRQAKFWSNSLKPFVNVRNVQIVMDGITIGIVTLNRIWRGLAPSILAASINSPGIFWIPEI